MKLKTLLVTTVLFLASITTTFPVKANITNEQVQGINDVSVTSNPSVVNQLSQPYIIAKSNWVRLSGGRSRRINLRTRPTINSPTSGYGLGGDRVQNLQCVQDKDRRGSQLNWCKVKFPKSGAFGWVRSDNIIFSDGGE
ncbi:SH3 domain-containing protein [Nostoc sp.]|uniref:SH3 domain-containing protein n=1 Tax=Nostoc sp. TaxID=1180 RepID=UPI002FFC236B